MNKLPPSRTDGSRDASRRGRWTGILLWAIFGMGLVIEAFAPRLQIVNRAFVIPPSMASAGQNIRPAEIVARERIMQSLSALLTAGGALGLAFFYRRALVRLRSPRRDHISGSC
jgi:hypothetical protein